MLLPDCACKKGGAPLLPDEFPICKRYADLEGGVGQYCGYCLLCRSDCENLVYL